MTNLYIFVVVVSAYTFGMLLGAKLGWDAADHYWKKRIEDRPESIHFGPYPKEFDDLRKN